jgi:hypothetical protein
MKLLATRKGFDLRETHWAGQYQLFDRTTALPEINRLNDMMYFTLSEVAAFLEPLRDRSSPGETRG